MKENYYFYFHFLSWENSVMEKIIIFAFTFYNDQIQDWKVSLAFTFYDDQIQLWKGIISSPFISICNYFLELSTKLNSYCR